MKSLFDIEWKSLAVSSALLLSFFTTSSYAQEQNQGAKDSHKSLYGIHVGLTESNVSLYYAQSGEAHALEQGNHSFYTPGFSLAVIEELPLGQCFSLRIMPGITLVSQDWEPTGVTFAPASPTQYKMESACANIPVDVKFTPFHTGNWRPYLCSGLSYSLDFRSISKKIGNESILQLNTHNLNYTLGLGVDVLTSYLRFGIELKTGLGILPTRTNNLGNTNLFHFQNSPIFCIGINVEA